MTSEKSENTNDHTSKIPSCKPVLEPNFVEITRLKDFRNFTVENNGNIQISLEKFNKIKLSLKDKYSNAIIHIINNLCNSQINTNRNQNTNESK